MRCTLRLRPRHWSRTPRTSSPAAYQRQATCPVKLRPVGPHGHTRAEPRIAEPRPRRPPSKCRPPDGLGQRHRSDAVCSTARLLRYRLTTGPAATKLGPSLTSLCPNCCSPNVFGQRTDEMRGGLACPEPSRSRDRSPAIRTGCPFTGAPIEHDRQSGAPRVGAARQDPHRNAQTATRLVDEVVKSGYPLIARARARRGRHGRRGDWSQRRP